MDVCLGWGKPRIRHPAVSHGGEERRGLLAGKSGGRQPLVQELFEIVVAGSSLTLPPFSCSRIHLRRLDEVCRDREAFRQDLAGAVVIPRPKVCGEGWKRSPLSGPVSGRNELANRRA